MSSHVISYRKKDIIVSEEAVEYTVWHSTVVLEKPIHVRFWTKKLEFDMFSFGLKHVVQLKDKQGDVLQIVLQTYFNKRAHHLNEKFNEVLDGLWLHHFGEIQKDYYERLLSGGTLVFNEFTLTKDAIIQKEKTGELISKIYFEDTSLKTTYDQLIVSSVSDPNKFIAVKDRWDWDAPIITSLINQLCPLST